MVDAERAFGIGWRDWGRLRELPAAAALALLAASGCSGFVCTIAICGLAGEGPGMAVAAMAVGVLAFPTTYGMAFPLAVPLLCAVMAWSDARSGGATTRLRFSVLLGAATVGWIGVGCVGLVLGKA